MMFTRRTFLQTLGLAGVAAANAPLSRAIAQHGGGHTGVSSPIFPAFVDPLPIPPVLKPKKVGKNDVYTMVMKTGLHQCHRDLPPTTVWGFNGIFPGPTIRATVNRPVQITQTNNLPDGGSHSSVMMGTHYPAVHLHGAHVQPESDGHPADSILGGASRVYTYPNQQRACHMWYHDHTHGATGRNVYMGLAGLYLLDDPKEAALKLPRGNCEIPLVIMDRSFDAQGQMHYQIDAETLESGMFGDVLLVNGKVQPFLNVANRKYRFRILNASNARMYTLALSDGEQLVQIGTDGGLMQRPLYKNSIVIAPAERVDVIIDFAKYNVGSRVILENQAGWGRTRSIMEFKIAREETENAVIPQFLVPWEELEAPVTTRNFTLNRLLVNGELTWVINGYAYDSPNREVPTPKLGTVEHWRFINPTQHPHPMHMHLVQFQVVNIDGDPQDPSDYGWKDTVVVPPGSEVTVAAKFTGYLGKYVFHCHNLEHEDYAMMGEFQVVP